MNSRGLWAPDLSIPMPRIWSPWPKTKVFSNILANVNPTKVAIRLTATRFCVDKIKKNHIKNIICLFEKRSFNFQNYLTFTRVEVWVKLCSTELFPHLRQTHITFLLVHSFLGIDSPKRFARFKIERA